MFAAARASPPPARPRPASQTRWNDERPAAPRPSTSLATRDLAPSRTAVREPYVLSMSAPRRRQRPHMLGFGDDGTQEAKRPLFFRPPKLYSPEARPSSAPTPEGLVSPRWIAPQLRVARKRSAEYNQLDSIPGHSKNVLGYGLSPNAPASSFAQPIDYKTRVAAKLEACVQRGRSRSASSPADPLTWF